MGWFIYEKESVDGDIVLTNRRVVHPGGKNGPLKKKALESREEDKISYPDGIDRVPWCIEEMEIIRSFGHDPDDHVLLSDFKENNKNNISFYRLRKIAGLSDPEWTPVVLFFELLLGIDKSGQEIKLADHKPGEDEAAEFREKFRFVEKPGDRVWSTSWLQGGYDDSPEKEKGRSWWNWPPPSRLNAAIFFPEQSEYFLRLIKEWTTDKSKK